MPPTFTATLGRPPRLAPPQALFLDFDGTLVSIAATPDAVRVDARLPATLAALREHLEGALAIVTGRRLESVDAHLHPFVGIAAGAHGAERRAAPQSAIEATTEPLPAAWIAALAARLHALPGVWLENKCFGVAVHFRQNPAAEAQCRRIVEAAAAQQGLHAVPGHCVIEARRAHIGKGRAIEALMRLPGFAGRVPVFAGDDHADEEGFAAVQRLGGWGIRIGAGHSLARHRLDGVDDVHRWLHDALRIDTRRS